MRPRRRCPLPGPGARFVAEVAVGANGVGGDRLTEAHSNLGRCVAPGCAGWPGQEEEGAVADVERGDALAVAFDPDVRLARARAAVDAEQVGIGRGGRVLRGDGGGGVVVAVADEPD